MLFSRIRESPPVFVCQEHRAVLLAAWAAERQGLFGEGAAPFLVRLDAHPDMGERPRHWAHERSLATTFESTFELIEQQRPDDGGWVVTAMQWGLCAGVATFFVHDYHRMPLDNAPYDDHLGAAHPLWTFGSFREALDRGFARGRGRRLAWELGLDPETGAFAGQGPPLWVDIDLDFATHRRDDGSPLAWTAEDWERELGGAVGALLDGLLRRARLVTIATEPEFCGGMAGCGAVARELGRRFEVVGAI